MIAVRFRAKAIGVGCLAASRGGLSSRRQTMGAGRPNIADRHGSSRSWSGRDSHPASTRGHQGSQLGPIGGIIPYNASHHALFNHALKRRPSSRLR